MNKRRKGEEAEKNHEGMGKMKRSRKGEDECRK